MGNLIFDGKGIIGHDLIVKMKRSIEMLLQGFPPITVNGTAKEPITALTVYGHSTQSGTPTPENPVPIVSAGDEGEINVTVQGGNLLDEYFSSTNRGVSYTVDGSVVTFNGTTNSDSGRVSAGIDVTAKLTPGVKYYFKQFSEYGIDCDFMVHDSSGIVSFNKNEYTPNGTEQLVNLRVLLNDTNNVSGMEIDMTVPVALTINPNMYVWEPYKQPQTLTLSTPGGLPGIPVSSGGNYTDENGQQWICDEVDFKRGKYVQRVKKLSIDDFTNNPGVKPGTTGCRFAAITPDRSVLRSLPALCNYFPFDSVRDGSFSTEGNYIATDEMKKVFIRVTDDITFNEFHQTYPDLVAYYIIETPIETDLPAEEIAAYKALHTYSPTTTVTNDAEAWMKVGVIME